MSKSNKESIKQFQLSNKGAKFLGFPHRLDLYFNTSQHILLAVPTYYGSIGNDEWFHFDTPTQPEICKINHLDTDKHAYTFNGYRAHGGISFHLWQPSDIENVQHQSN